MNNNLNNNKNNINDHDYFMSVCWLASQRSKDPCTQVGACISDKNGNLIGIGYNGMPNGCDDDIFPWGKHSDDKLLNKHFYVCHAELNAIANSNRNLVDCTIYVSLFPCNECAKLIIQSGIKQVIYLSDKHAYKNKTIAARLMFDAANVKYWQHQPSQNVMLEFPEANTINVNTEKNGVIN